MSLDFRLIIPAYREINRLPDYLRSLQFSLASAAFRTEILIVDDGSPFFEQKALRQKIEVGETGNCRVSEPLFLPRNRGKGAAIMTGWSEAGIPARWFGFVDADGATPAREVCRIFNHIHAQAEPAEVYFTRRQTLDGRFTPRPFLRALAGLVFRRLVHQLIDPQVSDSQCGFKILSAESFPKIKDLIETSGYCFDIELLSVIRFLGFPLQELRIDWQDQRGSHMNVFYHSLVMVRELMIIRQRALQRAKSTDSFQDASVSSQLELPQTTLKKIASLP
jgi:dolichyl-phosphate beta-glucosyltransferase